MTKRLEFLERQLFFLAAFLLPTQFGLHFWPKFAFVYGIRVDYLAPTIYFSDLLIFFLLVLFFINDGKKFINFVKEQKVYFYCLLTFALLNILFSTNNYVSFFKWLKLGEAFFFTLYLIFRKEFLVDKKFIKTLFASGVVFSLIGILQVLLSRTTGLFYLLGERTFNLSTPGIALFTFAGHQVLRSYSTFSHPNSLAGFLGILIILVFWKRPFLNNGPFYLGLLVILLAFVLTFSLSAALGLMFVSLIALFVEQKKWLRRVGSFILLSAILLSLFMPTVSSPTINFKLNNNITQRLELAHVSGKIISNNFFTGVGANNFISNSVKVVGLNNYIWALQPVHNIFLFVLSEYGVLGIILVFLFFFKLLGSPKREFVLATLFIVVVGLFDHYFLTLQQNFMYLSLLAGLSFSSQKS